jgi:AraC-like DNA-binding protein
VADARHMTSRTLRRHLKAENTSFSAIPDDFYLSVAVRYISETDMSDDDIATPVGFTDVSNFRRAFKRWTRRTPGNSADSRRAWTPGLADRGGSAAGD